MHTSEQLTDEQLIFNYREGDSSAFVEIVNRHLKPVYNFIYRLCGDKKDAEEIAQESFLKVWKNIERFREGEKFKTWFYTIARNTTIDWMRKKKSLIFSEFDREDGGNFLEDNLVDTEPVADELFELGENKKIVEELLLELPVHYREVLLLRYHKGLDFSEIAIALKRSINTIKSQHRRVLLILRKKIADAPK